MEELSKLLESLPLSTRAFHRLQAMFHEASGIKLADAKRTLVAARLRKRVEALELPSFDAYCDYVGRTEQERQLAIDLLTTNETFFFREPSHFEFLGRELERRQGERLRIWSAACSTGEEPYSIAMTLLARRQHGCELLASDLSQRVLERAARGIYSMNRLQHMPPQYLRDYCQRGTGDYDGLLRIGSSVRQSVQFFPHNLMHSAKALGELDIIFLRNVLIYFEPQNKQRIVAELCQRLRPGGLLFLGQAEVLPDAGTTLQRVERSVFRRR